jgi:predicted MPP superfamily phosphohydrolase
MEAHREKHTPKGGREKRHWDLFEALIGLFGWGLRLVGLYRRGVRNALDIRLTRLELAFEDLPVAFDGFTILQISDLHVDTLRGTTEAALRLVSGMEVDLCVLTGDYREALGGPFDHILPPVRDLVSRVSARHGICAILGNRDCADMVEAFERLGITVLVNETRSIRRGDSRLHVTGTDDAHYYTDAARNALALAPDGFRIALVHSAELADMAADNGFRLYLSGHTHGGQVCLPGGRPILTNLSRHRGYASGLWAHGAMSGYTSTGVGVSALPVRFNSRGEVALITLRRGEPGPGNR